MRYNPRGGRGGIREWPMVMLVRVDSTVCSHLRFWGGGPAQQQMVTWVGVRARVQPSKPVLYRISPAFPIVPSLSKQCYLAGDYVSNKNKLYHSFPGFSRILMGFLRFMFETILHSFLM